MMNFEPEGGPPLGEISRAMPVKHQVWVAIEAIKVASRHQEKSPDREAMD